MFEALADGVDECGEVCRVGVKGEQTIRRLKRFLRGSCCFVIGNQAESGARRDCEVYQWRYG
ncbi:unnamed protein product [Choristocarpus tenellus]